MTSDTVTRHCEHCQRPIKWVSYIVSDSGFWMHVDGERRCALVATPIPMDEHGIEYM